MFPVVQLDFEGLIATDLSSDGMNCPSPAPEYLPTLHLPDGLNQIVHRYAPQTSLKIPHRSNTPARFKGAGVGWQAPHPCCGLDTFLIWKAVTPKLRSACTRAFPCAFRQGTARLITQESRMIWINRECG